MPGTHQFNRIPLLVGTVVGVAIIIPLAFMIGCDSKAGARTGEQLVQATCFTCHGAGLAGAPAIGDKSAWEPLIAKGLDGLLKSAIAGKNAMPPRGGANATDAELARAIAYMANKSGAKFTEPK
ncbi:MAG TPA: hypothetical protein DCZ01_10975 [Elusimicrobia bacterium]|nr:MAG: hypothetical protein A2X37_01965 [Elusimicrobia bacterium GWA2_66_18]HAZ09013.1 hypothetical protein [Elusimicrobiota bacterium]